jgi:hypothetical protein
MMFLEINRLVCEITNELYALEKVYDKKYYEKYNFRLELFNDIQNRMIRHVENMKHISEEHKYQYDARVLEVYNKENDITEQVRLQQVRNYISSRIEDSNILNEHLKVKYDNHMNDLLEKLHNVYNEINKINDNDNIITYAHAAAVQHSVHQALLQDNKRIKTYNKKQYEKKCILDELIRICKLEQTQILQVKQFQYQHDMYMMSTHDNYQQTANNNQKKFEEQLNQERELKFECEQELKLELECEQELKLELEREQELKLELEREQELKLKQNLEQNQNVMSIISDTNEWLNAVD